MTYERTIPPTYAGHQPIPKTVAQSLWHFFTVLAGYSGGFLGFVSIDGAQTKGVPSKHCSKAVFFAEKGFIKNSQLKKLYTDETFVSPFFRHGLHANALRIFNGLRFPTFRSLTVSGNT